VSGCPVARRGRHLPEMVYYYYTTARSANGAGALFIFAKGFDAFGAGKNSFASKRSEFFVARLRGHFDPLQIRVFADFNLRRVVFAS